MLSNGGPGLCDYLAPVAEMIDDLVPDFAYPWNMVVNKEGNRSRTQFLSNPDLVERIRALDVPTIIIQGERDLRPNWSSEQLAQLLPNARYHEIPEAEHCLWLTHPQELRDLLRGFLQS
jgi:proline iminopeptidase